MISQHNLIHIGKLLKPHGFKGEIGVEMQYPKQIYDNKEIPFFLKIDNIIVPFFVENIRGGSHKITYIKFEGVDSDLQAASLSKKELYAEKEYIANALGVSEDELDLHAEEFIGFEVVDAEKGEKIGIAEGIEDGVEYDYLIVRKIADNQTIHIPFIDEFVASIEEDKESAKGLINVLLPEGFLEI